MSRPPFSRDFPHVLGYAADEPDGGAASPEFMAAMDFEAWKPDPTLIPTNKEWADAAEYYLPPLRIAHSFMQMTKPELCAALEKFENFQHVLDLLNLFDEGEALFGGYVRLLEAARARIHVGVATLADEQDKRR